MAKCSTIAVSQTKDWSRYTNPNNAPLERKSLKITIHLHQVWSPHNIDPISITPSKIEFIIFHRVSPGFWIFFLSKSTTGGSTAKVSNFSKEMKVASFRWSTSFLGPQKRRLRGWPEGWRVLSGENPCIKRGGGLDTQMLNRWKHKTSVFCLGAFAAQTVQTLLLCLGTSMLRLGLLSIMTRPNKTRLIHNHPSCWTLISRRSVDKMS